MAEPVIFAMDGSTSRPSAALLLGSRLPGAADQSRAPAETGEGPRGAVLARRTDVDGRGQARTLLRLADDMLRQTGRTSADIGALVVGIGPGTFTGVRIAVATARALALALSAPVVGVSTLSALAAEAAAGVVEGPHRERPGTIVPLVDARRGQVFYGLYRWNGDAYVRTEPVAVCDRAVLLPRLTVSTSVEGKAQVLVVGELEGLLQHDPYARRDSPRLRSLQLAVGAEWLLLGQHLIEEPEGEIGGRVLGAWLTAQLQLRTDASARDYTAGEVGSPEAVRPIYVRSPDADVHITKMRDPWTGATTER